MTDAIVTIREGAATADGREWERMLMTMFSRWAERHQRATSIVGAGAIRIAASFDELQREQGIHRLVRTSPFGGRQRRDTTHAAVTVRTVDDRRSPEDMVVRAYVLDPYTMAHDLRTGTETHDVAAVLDGNLELLL